MANLHKVNFTKMKIDTFGHFMFGWTLKVYPGNTEGGSITVPLISCLNGMATDNFCFYLQNRLIQTSQTGGQLYSDSFPFSIPWLTLSPCIQTTLRSLLAFTLPD